jgi:hypothetical protein
MGAKPSELMLDLLKELALLKELDEKSRESAVPDPGESDVRERRRREICEQIKALAEPLSS